MPLKIASVQLHIKPNDPDHNLQRMASFIEKAAKAKCHLIVFPEDAVAGPLAGQTAHTHRSLEFFTFFQALAKKHNIDIVPGSWVLPDGGRLYNTAYYINSDGTLAGEYRKIHLWDTELATITPGIINSVFTTRFGVTGLAICWDISFPDIFSAMKASGAELIIVPAYWSYTNPGTPNAENKDKDEAVIDSLCIARAFENDLTLVFCNAGGDYKNAQDHAVLIGHSRVATGTGVEVKSSSNKEEMLYFSYAE